MNLTMLLFAAVILLIFVFGLTNGIIDGGGLVSTVITTRALEPLWALMVIAASEVLGLFVLGQAVAHILAHRMVIFPPTSAPMQMLGVLAAALAGALAWNTAMWRLALPSSSSHALVGGITGAMVMEFGLNGMDWWVLSRIVLYLALVPLAGMALGWAFARGVYWIGEFLLPAAGRLFRSLQVLALAGVGMVHGSNDGQKSLAMMMLAMMALGNTGSESAPMPWVMLLVCGAAIGLGVIFGSRRMIRTVGKRLYRVENLQGFSAETSAFFLVGGSSLLGYPMSMTHVMSASILGAGVAVRPRGVRWQLVGDIGLVWLVTIPATAALSAVIMWMLRYVVS